VDVYLDDGSTSKAGEFSAAAYSFAGGMSNPVKLWSRLHYETPQSIDQGTDSIVDLDGDGLPEVVLTSADVVSFLRGDDASGIGSSVIAYLKPASFAGHPFANADSIAAELDGDSVRELVVIQREGQVAGQYGPPNLIAFKVDPLTQVWSHLWTRTVGNFEGEMVGLADVAADLNGDGRDEVIFSHRVPPSSALWTTDVLDGKTGATLATLSGARFEGAADLDEQPGAEIVVATPNGLVAHGMQNGSLVALTGPLAGFRAITMVDAAARQHGQGSRRLAVITRPGKPPVMLAGNPATTAPYEDLPLISGYSNAQSLTVDAGGWVLGPLYTPLAGGITDVMRADFSTRPYEQFAMGTGDGTVDVLDEAMQVTNGISDQNDPPAGTLIGGAMQNTIGDFASPLIGIGAEMRLVVLPGSSKGMLVADASSASLVIPPAIKWTGADMQSPSIVSLGPVGKAVVGIEGYTLAARYLANGSLIHSVSLGPGYAWGVPLPLSIPGSETPLVGIDWRTPGVQIVQTAVDFGSGTIAWAGSPIPYGGFFGSSVGDLDNDGLDEWYSVAGSLLRRAGNTGALTEHPALATGYAIPMIASFNGTATRDVLLQSGANKKLALATSSLTLDWQIEVDDQINVMAGAYVGCVNGARFVTPSVQSPTLRAYDGPTGSKLGEVVLAGGSAFASVAQAEQAQARIGWLTNASSIEDAGGSGPVVLVGSSDGFLYALNGCTLSLAWSVSLGAPVAAPIIGTVDNDDSDEIVVGAADGYVYGLDWPELERPHCIVVDNVGCDGKVLAVAVGESVSASWDAVTGATGYEMALLTPDDHPLWDPPYRAANGTSGKVELAGGLANRPYRIAVRAVQDGLRGAEAFSAPIVISDSTPPVVEVTVTAPPGKTTPLHLEAADDLALDHYVVSWKESAAGDESFAVVTDGMLSGKDSQADLMLTLPQESYGKSLVLAVDVVDSGWNMGGVWLAATVSPDGVISVTPAPPGPSADVPPADALAACACTAGGPRKSSAWTGWMLAALLGSALRRSLRRRNPSA
jgi:outer membrane protein assembly factor BamB